jgi:hypothetical protein
LSVREAQEVVRYSRRLVLGLLASAAGAGGEAMAQAVRAAGPAAAGSERIQPGALQAIQQTQNQQPGVIVQTEILVPIIRPDDLLVLNVVLRNLSVTKAPNQRIVPSGALGGGVMIVSHQPQSILEQAWQDFAPPPAPQTPYPPGAGTASSRMSGPSYVAYDAPPGFTSMPFTLKDILNALQTWPMRLDVNAQPLPADPLGLVGSLHSLDSVKAELIGAAATLKAQLGVSQSQKVVNALERAAGRLSATMSNVALQGRVLTQQDLKTAVAAEVNASFGPRAANPGDRKLASGYVEAAAASKVIVTLAPTKPHELTGEVTSLEIPYQLFQSPLDTAGWTHADTLVTHGQHTELWHSRLGTNVSGVVVELDGEPVRALWTSGYDGKKPVSTPPWPTVAMTASDRHSIVELTSDWFQTTKSGSKYVPQPSLAKRLMLTAMGGTLDLDAHWPVRPSDDNLEAWNHKAAIGRDYYVRLVYAGWLYPFGHAASYIKITERKFGTQANGKRVATMLQRQFILVREHSKTYPGKGQANDGRDFPFQTLEIVTKATPNLVEPAYVQALQSSGTYYDAPPAGSMQANEKPWYEGFWPIELATNQDFHFHLVGTDGAGRKIPFEMPLFFLADTKNDQAHVKQVEGVYKAAGDARTKASMRGAKIQFAPDAISATKTGDTSYPTTDITFDGAAPTGAVPVTKAQFFPALKQATVQIPSVKAMLGADAKPTVSYSDIYKQNGFLGANKGQVFLDLAKASSLSGDAQNPPTTFGGMLSPSLVPAAMSRTFGAVQGGFKKGAPPGPPAGPFGLGNFDPADFFPDDFKLLGAVPLKDVITTIIDVTTNPGAAPVLSNVELPDKIVATYTLSRSDLQPALNLFLPDSGSSLSVTATVVAKRDGSPPTSDVNATINKFRINLFGFIILQFDSLVMTAATGQKTNVQPHLNTANGVMFGGPLEFVNGLRDVIPMDGFDGGGLAVAPTGITASYSLSLPTIGVGVASLSNVSLGAGFDLPFTGDPPSARFNFATRQSPFNLTVSLFGGGGFFLIGVGAAGVIEIEAALEFGAQISIDLGVASGGVYVKGGFYFHWIGATSEVDFEGYVELGGHLSILGLISVSLTFHLGLAYQKLPPASKLYGEATLTVEVTVLFFSFGVDVHVEKQFAGSHSDPTFLMFAPTQAVWTQYCDAFA